MSVADGQGGSAVIEATLLRMQHLTVGGVPAIKAVLRDSSGSIMVMWRDNGLQGDLQTGKRYILTGALKHAPHGRIMVDPTYTVAAEPVPKLAARRKINKLTLKITAGILLLIFIGAIAPSSPTPDTKNLQSQAAVSASTTDKDSKTAAEPQSKPQEKLTPDDCDEVAVPYTATTRNDPATPVGQTGYAPHGVNGTDSVCYVHGRAKPPTTTHVTQPVNEVKLVGTYVAPAPPPARVITPPPSYTPPPAASVAPSGGRTGATCRDGTHSNATGSGACSHHGGVAQWLY